MQGSEGKVSWSLRLNLNCEEDLRIYEKVIGRNKNRYRKISDFIYAAVASYEDDLPAAGTVEPVDYEKIADTVKRLLEEQNDVQCEDENIRALLEMDR